MKKHFLFLFGLLLLIAGGCSNEDSPTLGEKTATEKSVPSNLERALTEADRIMAVLDGGQTRSSRRISTIEKVRRNATRSEGEDVNWYVVNYGTNDGFALVTDAPVVSPVYGISNEGSLNIADTIENKGLAMVLEGIFTSKATQELVEDVVPIGPPAPDTIINPSPYPPGLEPDKPINPPVISIVVSPILTPTVAKWDQEEPFNCLCAMVTDEKTGLTRRGSVGCLPLAVAMIMSHYSWPDSYYSASPDMTFNFDWDLVRNSPYRYVISQLTREVSRAYNLDADWKYDGTSASAANIPRTFVNFKYTIPLKQKFIDVAYSMLLAGSPALVTGRRTTDSTKGHAWVIDGIMKESLNDLGWEPNAFCTYYHCVWGWGGLNNGYFSIPTYSNTVPTDNGYKWDEKHIRMNRIYEDLTTYGHIIPMKPSAN